MQENGKNIKSGGYPDLKGIQSGFHMEADRIANMLSVSIMGVFAILDFSEACAIFKMRKGRIKICGSGLSVAVYDNKTVEIIGKVDTVEFI